MIPVIVRPTDWERSPFSKLQALPKDVRPITKWNNRDEAWLEVAKGIRRAIKIQREKKQEREVRSIVSSTMGGIMTDEVGAITSDLEIATRLLNPRLLDVHVRYAGAVGWYTVAGSPVLVDERFSEEELHELVVRYLTTPGSVVDGYEEPRSLQGFSPAELGRL